MNCRDITIYLDERWCKTLEAHNGLPMESLLTGGRTHPRTPQGSAGADYT